MILDVAPLISIIFLRWPGVSIYNSLTWSSYIIFIHIFLVLKESYLQSPDMNNSRQTEYSSKR